MTRRCLYARCRSCGGLMYIDEAEVVTCGCPGYWPSGVGTNVEQSLGRVRRVPGAEVTCHKVILEGSKPTPEPEFSPYFDDPEGLDDEDPNACQGVDHNCPCANCEAKR